MEQVVGSVQSTNVTYELQSLGWKAFQDLCATILGEVLGQTIQVFLPSRDGGRDGAFSGNWTPRAGETLSGPFTVQCKFTSRRDSPITFSDLADELQKARRLAANNLATTYILMTNYSVSGVVEEELRNNFLAIDGIESFLAFGNDWITLKIRESPRLRMLVPRVYGLGDLSQILDERALAQARDILFSMGDDLSKFVVTSAHRKSAKALVEHGFVLLLGEPASGKSTIAASLALGAIDIWRCSTLKVQDAADFIRHWNPLEPKQFFWVDDVFGATQYQRTSADEWNRTFLHLQAAIRKGARVLFTSRDYIFNSARADLKLTAFPLLSESQVIINVQDLSKDEKEQILYNHIKLGSQPMGFRRSIRPYLSSVAANPRFLPEIARRLADPIFTRDLSIDLLAVKDFVERPRDFIVDVIRSLDRNSRAALALIFMEGNKLQSPLDIDQPKEQTLKLLGAQASGVREALSSLRGSFVKLVRSDEQSAWTYQHPTVGDALSLIIAEDPELTHIYLRGTPAEQLIREVVCGDVEIEGAKVIVMPTHFKLVGERLKQLKRGDQLYYFLAFRCSKAFLKHYLEADPVIFQDISSPGSYLNSLYTVDLLVRLFEFDLLPEDVRQTFVNRAGDLAVETPDADLLRFPKIRSVFRQSEIDYILERIKTELIPTLSSMISGWTDGYSSEEDPEDYFGGLIEALEGFQTEFAEDDALAKLLDDALDKTYQIVESLKEDFRDPSDYHDYFDESRSSGSGTVERDIFDDIDQ